MCFPLGVGYTITILRGHTSPCSCALLEALTRALPDPAAQPLAVDVQLDPERVGGPAFYLDDAAHVLISELEPRKSVELCGLGNDSEWLGEQLQLVGV